MPIEVTLPMVLDAHADARFQDTHTAVPGQIVSWSATTQTATVQPMVRKPLPSADGIQTYETPPQIQNVPCYVLRGGGYLVSVPFAVGDPVWLMFSEQSYAEYLSTGALSNPKDLRRHGTGYPFAIPGPAPASLALQSVSSTALVIGRDGQDELIMVSPGLIQAGASGTQPLATKADLSNVIGILQNFLGNGLNFATTASIATAASIASTSLSAAANYTVLFKTK